MTPNDNPFPEETEYLDEIAEGVGASEPSTPPLNPFPKDKAYLAEIAENISSATQFIGVTSTALTDGATTNPITINGASVTAVAGNITSYGADEYIFNGTAWQLFGAANAAPLVCTFSKSGNNIVCDKTRAEILAAYDAGKQIYGKGALNTLFASALGGVGTFMLSNVDEANNRHVRFYCTYTTGDNNTFLLEIMGTTFLASIYTWSTKETLVPSDGLPDVTTDDNGKMLVVEDGAWVADENDFVVTFNKNGSTWTTDASFDAIEAAFNAGKNIYGQTSGTNVTTDNSVRSFTLILPLSGFSSTYGFVFGGSYQSQTNTIFATIIRQRLTVQGFTKTIVVGSYSKPSGGIPESDLSADVQTKLNSGGSGGGVDSVNGYTGVVSLNAADVGAVASVNGNGPDGSGNVEIHELPDPGGSIDTILMTNHDTGAVTWAYKSSVYPNFDASDEGKVLTVNSSGDVVWGNAYVVNVAWNDVARLLWVFKSDGTETAVDIPPALRIVSVNAEDRAATAQLFSPILTAAANNLNTPQAFSIVNPAMVIRLLQITNQAVNNSQLVVFPAAIDSNDLPITFLSTSLKADGFLIGEVTFTAQFDYRDLRYDVSMLITADGVVEVIATATSPSYSKIPTGMHTISEVLTEIRDSVNAMRYNDLYGYMQARSGFAIPFNDAGFDSTEVEFIANNVDENDFQIVWDDVTYGVEVTFDTTNETFTIDRVFCIDLE